MLLYIVDILTNLIIISILVRAIEMAQYLRALDV